MPALVCSNMLVSVAGGLTPVSRHGDTSYADTFIEKLAADSSLSSSLATVSLRAGRPADAPTDPLQKNTILAPCGVNDLASTTCGRRYDITEQQYYFFCAARASLHPAPLPSLVQSSALRFNH